MGRFKAETVEINGKLDEVGTELNQNCSDKKLKLNKLIAEFNNFKQELGTKMESSEDRLNNLIGLKTLIGLKVAQRC